MADILWAPWRMTYIEKSSSDNPGGDIFVDLPAEQDDAKNFILFRGTHAFVMLNAFPYSGGHILVAPYRQVPDLEGLNDSELLEINQLLAKSVSIPIRITVEVPNYRIESDRHRFCDFTGKREGVFVGIERNNAFNLWRSIG